MKTYENRRGGRLWRWIKRSFLAMSVFAVVAGAGGYLGLPVLARTDWARRKVEASLGRTLGAAVKVGTLEASWRRGLVLRDILIDPTGYGGIALSGSVREFRLKPRYGKLLRGPLRAEAILDEPAVAIREARANVEGSAPRIPCLARHGLKLDRLEIRGGAFTFASPEEDLRVEDLNVSAILAASRSGVDIEVQALSGRLFHGGTIAGEGMVALRRGEIRTRLDVTGTDVAAGDLVARAIQYAIPLLQPQGSGSPGRITLRLKAQGAGPDGATLLREASGEGAFLLREIRLHAPPASLHANEVEGFFSIGDGKVVTREAMAHGSQEFRLHGSVDLQGRVKHTIEAQDGPAPLRVTGTLDRLEIDSESRPR